MTRPRILIVEDETIVARDLRLQLQDLGYEPVGNATTGEEAVALVGQLLPDLVLMDVRLAGEQDGISTAGIIHRRYDIPVVFLTAFAGLETLARAKQAEPFGYIIKPFDERELRTVVEMALYKHGSERRLRESEQKLRTILENSSQLHYSHGPEGVLTYVSPQSREFFECEPEEACIHWTEFVTDHPANARAVELTRTAIQTGQRQPSYELEMRGKRGRRRWVKVSESPVVVEGRTVAIVGVLTDITATKRSEDLLRLQAAALTAADNAIVITDLAGTVSWVNSAFCRLTGYSVDEAVGKNPRDLVRSGQESPEKFKELWDTILAGKVWTGEMINRRKDGSLYLEEQTITPVHDAAGAITHFIGIKQDLTEHKRAEEALRQSEERYRGLFEQNPMPMWVMDFTTLDFLAVNDAAVRHYGYTRDEFLNMTIKELRPPEDVPALVKSIRESTPGEAGSSEWRHRRKDGAILQVEVFFRPLTFDGKPARLVLANDITEKKLVQEKFLHAQRLESLGMLASGIAHDLNNVLAPIIFVAPLLRATVTSTRDLKILDTLEQSAERGAGLVKQILGFARTAASEPQSIQIKHLVRDIMVMMEETFPKAIKLEQAIASDAWLTLGNPTQLHQVFLNLCVNARDAMPRGGRLQVRVANRRLGEAETRTNPKAMPGDWVMVEVADTGTGIPPDVVERMWDPFFTTKPAGRGTGLGLSTVRGIVASHGGFIEVETEVGRGSTFRVFLPATGEQAGLPTSPGAATALAGQGELILVVDDDAAIRDVVSQILLARDYRVVPVADGVEALNVFTARMGEFALVITDVDMPRMGGGLLAKVLLELRPAIRLLAMSGYESSSVDVDGIRVAKEVCHAFLHKPFTPEDLLLAVARLVRSTPPS